MNICYILRGLPGSGKSFVVKQILEHYGIPYHGHVFSTDNFYIPVSYNLKTSGEIVPLEEERQEYISNWSQEKQGIAHSNNLKLFKIAVYKEVSLVIVDNTNVNVKSFKEYKTYAEGLGYKVIFKEPISEWWKLYSPYLKDKVKYNKELNEFAAVLASKNTHGVPLGVIFRMIMNWEEVEYEEDI